MLRTISIKLLVSAQTDTALKSVQSAFSEACNNIVPFAKAHRVFNNVKLHHLCYYDIRAHSPLGSQFVCNAIKSVAGKYKALKLKKEADVPVIHFKPKSVHYDKKTYTLLDENTVSLTTLSGCQRHNSSGASISELFLIRDWPRKPSLLSKKALGILTWSLKYPVLSLLKAIS